MRGEEAARAETQLSSISNQTRRGGTSDTHERRQEGRFIASPCLFWIILVLTFLSWRFLFLLALLHLPPDEKQEY